MSDIRRRKRAELIFGRTEKARKQVNYYTDKYNEFNKMSLEELHILQDKIKTRELRLSSTGKLAFIEVYKQKQFQLMVEKAKQEINKTKQDEQDLE